MLISFRNTLIGKSEVDGFEAGVDDPRTTYLGSDEIARNTSVMTYSNAARLALLVGSLTLVGCDDTAQKESGAPTATAPLSPSDATITAAPSTNAAAAEKPADTKETPTEAKPADAKPAEPAPEAKPADAKHADATPAAEPPANPAVKLEPVKFDAFLARMAQNKDSKYTIVDVWASWCIPCKENFPHLLELDKKYASKGLKVASLSFDDPAEPKQVSDAKKFLTEKNATITNYLLDEESGVGNEKLNISAIPAVFIYGPDGKEVKRFTLDDPNHQFTYSDVEKAVVALLDGKPIPEGLGDKPAAK